MDSLQIREIVSWLRTHSDEPGTDAEIWSGFCRRPSLIKEMNTMKNRVYARNARESCVYVFSHTDDFLGETCRFLRVPGKDRCQYHDHLIFSKELRKYLQQMHEESKQQIDVKPAGSGLFREIKHNLAIRMNAYGTPYCAGYFSSEGNDSIIQLTPELRAFCRKIDLSYS